MMHGRKNIKKDILCIRNYCLARSCIRNHCVAEFISGSTTGLFVPVTTTAFCSITFVPEWL